MTLSMTAAVQPTATVPRVRLDIMSTNTAPNAIGPTAPFTIWRTHPDGSVHQVITEANAALSGGSSVEFDYHAPYNVPLVYTVTIGSVSVAAGTLLWTATAPNLMPVDPGTGGAARFNDWLIGSVHTTSTDGTLAVTGSVVVYSPFIPAAVGNNFYFGVNTTSAVVGAVGIDYWDGTHRLSTTSASISAGRGGVTATAPAGTTRVRVYVATGTTTLSHPVIAAGTTDPGALDPTSAVLTGSYSLAVAATWLLHPSDPTLSIPVDAVVSIGDRAMPESVGRFKVLGRGNAVFVTDGVRGGITGDLTIRYDPADEPGIIALFANSGPILIDTPGTTGWDIDWMWVQPLGVSMNNPAGGLVVYTRRHVTIPFEQVDQPVATSGALWTYSSAQAVIATYPASGVFYATYRDAVTDSRH